MKRTTPASLPPPPGPGASASGAAGAPGGREEGKVALLYYDDHDYNTIIMILLI